MRTSLFDHRGQALRRGRFSEPGRIYLLTAVTQNRDPVFMNWRLGRLLVFEMRMLHERLRSFRWLGLLCRIICIGLSSLALSRLRRSCSA